jgi:hypothetical protein
VYNLFGAMYVFLGSASGISESDEEVEVMLKR